MNWWNRVKQHPFFIKLLNWEYWPTFAFYWPVCFVGPYLAVRSGHPVFFTAANPGLPTGGTGMESKYETLNKFPEAVRPRSVLWKAGEDMAPVLADIRSQGLDFPLVAKPDVGYRGFLVRKVHNEEELVRYLQKYSIDFIIQEYLDFPEEVGIFYYRLPGEEKGKVISITMKEFLYVKGNGHKTVQQLVEETPRALLQLERLQETHAEVLGTVPAKGEKVSLGIVGNHAKGTLFINGNHHIDEELTNTFDQLSKSIPGFHYGRYDIKCGSFDALRRGKDFKIIELNGVGAEPTHIYDPNAISYFGALRTMIRHWRIIGEVASANHRNGTPYMSTREFLSSYQELKAYKRKVKMLSMKE